VSGNSFMDFVWGVIIILGVLILLLDLWRFIR
jgi:hypothetical protein